MDRITVNPPAGSSSRAPAADGEYGEDRSEQGGPPPSEQVGRHVPPESLELLQSRLPKLKGLKVNTEAVEPRL